MCDFFLRVNFRVYIFCGPACVCVNVCIKIVRQSVSICVCLREPAGCQRTYLPATGRLHKVTPMHVLTLV